MLTALLAVAGLVGLVGVVAHGNHDHQDPIAGPHKGLWYNNLPGDGGTQVHGPMGDPTSSELMMAG